MCNYCFGFLFQLFDTDGRFCFLFLCYFRFMRFLTSLSDLFVWALWLGVSSGAGVPRAVGRLGGIGADPLFSETDVTQKVRHLS